MSTTVAFYSHEEVASHYTPRSVWITVDGKVYDVSSFLFDHPGGEELILQNGGKDVSKVMRDHLEHDHSDAAFDMLAEYYIGELATPNTKDHQTSNYSQYSSSASTPFAAPPVKEKFIDLTKPLVPQVWHANFSKAYYMQQVHIPRHVHGSATIFGGLLEIATITPWWVIPLVWFPVVVYEFYRATFYTSLPVILAIFALGIVNWSFLEYFLHRFLFHIDDFLPDNRIFITLHFLTHGIHHMLPMDGYRLVMPPVLLFILSIPIYNIYALILPTWALYPATSGTYMGYIMYDLTHYYIHHGKPFLAHLREMKTYHLDHHYKEPTLGFGITSKMWDYVFKTVLY